MFYVAACAYLSIWYVLCSYMCMFHAAVSIYLYLCIILLRVYVSTTYILLQISILCIFVIIIS